MLTLSEDGAPIAKIVGGKYNNKVVSVSVEEKGDKHFKFLGMANNAKLQRLPNPKRERQVLYTTGPAAAAKAPVPESIQRTTNRRSRATPSTSSRPCPTTSHWTTSSRSA